MAKDNDLPRLPGMRRLPAVEPDVRAWQEAPDYGYDSPPPPEWRDRLAVVLRYKWLVLLCTVAGGAAGYWVAQRAIPEYTASAVLRVRSQPAARVPAAFLQDGPSDLPTEIELMRSRRMAGAVVDSLGMQVRTKPDISGVIADARLTSGSQMAVVALDFADETFAFVGGDEERLAEGRYGTSLEAAGIAVTIVQRPPGVNRAELQLRSREFAIDEVIATLRARARQGTEIVDVSFTAVDPALAADVVNTVIRVYQQASLDNATRRTRARQTFSSAQLVRADSAHTRAREELATFRAQSGIVGSSAQFELWHQSTLQRAADLVKLTTDRDVLNAIISSIGPDEPTDAHLQSLVYAPVIGDNPMVHRFYDRYLDLREQRRALVTGEFGQAESSPESQRLGLMARDARDEIISAARTATRILDLQIEAAQTHLAESEARLGELPPEVALEAELTRAVEASRSVVEELRAELLRGRIDEVLETGNVDIIDFATVPRRPISQRGPSRAALGLLLGLLVGVGGAFGLRQFNTTISDNDEAEAYLQIPGLGLIPRAHVQNGRAWRRLLRADAPAEAAVSDLPVAPSGYGYHSEPLNEAFRMLRTNLMFSRTSSEMRTLVITSALPGEGKTTTAANLAAALARQGARTLLIDADLRRPCLHALFNVRKSPGLTDMLLNGTPHDQLVCSTGVDRLYLLPAGQTALNPAEIFGSTAFETFLGTARETFNFVIIDTPPVMPFTDAAVLGAAVDAVVVVLLAGSTQRRLALEAVHRLERVGAKVIGTVLNGMTADGRNGYSYYDYSAYSLDER